LRPDLFQHVTAPDEVEGVGRFAAVLHPALDDPDAVFEPGRPHRRLCALHTDADRFDANPGHLVVSYQANQALTAAAAQVQG
jgi:hypothetical protein